MWVISLLYLGGLAIYFIPQADTKGEFVLLAYLLLSILINIFLGIANKNYLFNLNPLKWAKEDSENIIERRIILNEIYPLFFHIPVSFGLLGIWAIDITDDNKIWVSAYIIAVILIFFTLIGWWKMRKLLRKIYRETHDRDFFSFFPF